MSIIALLIWLIILCVVVALIYYVLDSIPVQNPLNRIVKMVVTVFAVIVLILLLLQLVGMGPGINLRM